jgi:carbamoyl-phosphate synthase small subunit
MTSTEAVEAALVVCEDGRVFRGLAWGGRGRSFGELVFTTGMTGYQETLTDPSFAGQLVVATAPHIGNTGMNDEDGESGRIQVSGYIVRDPARVPSSWRSRRSLDTALADSGVVGVAGVDTRALTRHLVEAGAMRGLLTSDPADLASPVADLVRQVGEQPTMTGADLAGGVSTTTAYVVPAVGARRGIVAAIDLGVKSSSPAEMARRGLEVHVLPSSAAIDDVIAVGADGVFLSNGPGDPATQDGPVALARAVLSRGIPLFGICFGNQILGRALGLGTMKLPYGHRGLNIPVLDRETGRVAITAQNHGFAVRAPDSAVDVDRETGRGTAAVLPSAEPFETPFGRARISHVCLNDGTVEGLSCLDVPAFSVQYHPEAAAGPHDANPLFDRFLGLVTAASSTSDDSEGVH